MAASSYRRKVDIANRRDPRLAGAWRVGLRVLVCGLLWLPLSSLVVVGLLVLRQVRLWARELPALPDLALWQAEAPQSSRVHFSDGSVQHWPFLDGTQTGYREIATLESWPLALRQAVIAAEDVRYWMHPGIDVRGMGRAMWNNWRAQRVVEGASTVTQQLVRNLQPSGIGRTQTPERKVKEALQALRLEQRYNKAQILEAYGNLVFLGADAYGVAAAARIYFAKSLGQLSVAEAAMIAGLIQAPSHLNPRVNPTGAVARRDEILRRMHGAGFLDASTLAQARATPLTLASPSIAPRASWAEEHVRRYMVAELEEELRLGGLDIYTTIDPILETALQLTLKTYVARAFGGDAPGLPQAAALFLDADTGYVRAMVGGRIEASQWNRATQSCRQPGSAWKPIVYAAGLDRDRLTAGTLLRDAPVVEIDGRNGELWKPRIGENFRGIVLAQDAIAYSLNSPAIEALSLTGAQTVIQFARRLGVTSEIPAVSSMALGSLCVTMTELVAAFGAFANGGLAVKPKVVTSVYRHGDALFDLADVHDPSLSSTARLSAAARSFGRPPHRVMRASTAFIMGDMLRGVTMRGTAQALRSMDLPVVGKTGTTNNNSDAWFVGYAGSLVGGVWLGHDDPKVSLGDGREAGAIAVPLWRELFLQVRDFGQPRARTEVPPDLVQVGVDSVTGLRRNGGRKLWFRLGTEPEEETPLVPDSAADFDRQTRDF